MVQAVDTRFVGAFWAMQAHAGALDMAVMKPDVSYFSAPESYVSIELRAGGSKVEIKRKRLELKN